MNFASLAALMACSEAYAASETQHVQCADGDSATKRRKS